MKTINTLKKVSLATLFTFVLSFSSVFAQNDTMYIMKAGEVVGKFNVNTQIDSVIFYKPIMQSDTGNTFTDLRDGNVYKTVTIGTQVWMAENLRYLPSVYGPNAVGTNTPVYYVYDYNGTNVTEAKATDNYTTYGVLYNWYAANDCACPNGWHLPSDAEWTQLSDYIGGTNEDVAVKLKKSGSTYWPHNSDTATNETGFSAIPGGLRGDDNVFFWIGYSAYWWSSTVYDLDVIDSYSRQLNGYFDRQHYSRILGFSVRCVKD